MKERVEKVFREILEDEDFIFNLDLRIEDIEGWDSLVHIQIILALEEEFNIKLTTQQITQIKSLKDIMDILE